MPELQQELDQTQVILCPRCGYDLRGVVAKWLDACPLEGTCAECGLHFKWAELLHPEKFEPRWCVEYAPRLRALPWRAVKTYGMTFWPWSFWRKLRMTDPPRWRNLVAYAAIILAVMYLAFAASIAAITWQHVGWNLTSGLTASAPRAKIALKAGVFPLSSHSPGNYNSAAMPAFWIPVSSPRDIFKTYWGEGIGQVVPAMTCVHLLCALGFVVLPVSRRKAKVRWRHIGRITLYGLALLSPPVLIYAAALGGPTLVELVTQSSFALLARLSLILMNVAGIMVVLYFPLELIWWSTATSRYLKMPHGWGVGVALMLMAGLATIVGLTIVNEI